MTPDPRSITEYIEDLRLRSKQATNSMNTLKTTMINKATFTVRMYPGVMYKAGLTPEFRRDWPGVGNYDYSIIKDRGLIMFEQGHGAVTEWAITQSNVWGMDSEKPRAKMVSNPLPKNWFVV